MGYVCGEGEALARKTETGEMESNLLGKLQDIGTVRKIAIRQS